MKFISDYELGFREIRDVARDYPSYTMALKVEGGWMLFESYDEYSTWKTQNEATINAKHLCV